MSANAYVLVTVDPARTEEVVRRLRSISGASVQEVLGPYDVVVELTSDTRVDLTSVVRSHIRSIPGVIRLSPVFGSTASSGTVPGENEGSLVPDSL